MCGIVGIWHLNQKPVSRQLLQEMTDCLRHRGPDDEGHVIDGSVALGSRRLSIIDLSAAGHMPMSNRERTVWITYNGEVYNYRELASSLKSKGFEFTSKTDTEVVLHSYEAFGPACLAEFNGMWSFAIWDRRQKKLFCAVDRFGIKPFYYYFDGEVFVFGSEIKSLLLHPAVPKRVNPQAVYDYLAFGYVDHSVETFFAGIKRLPAAHYLMLDQSGHLSITRWWDIAYEDEPRVIERPMAVEQFAELFRDAARLRLRSDVPIGTCLSGGLDSSAIVTVANQLIFGEQEVIDPSLVGERQKTFSACYEDARFDERPFIETVTRQTGAESNYIFPDGVDGLWAELPNLIWHQEEPFGSTSIFAQWNVMRRVSERGVKVVLDGQGGDELLAGYPKYFPYFLQQLLRAGQTNSFFKELRAAKNGAADNTALNYSLLGYLVLPRTIKSILSGIKWRFKPQNTAGVLQEDFGHAFAERREGLAEESLARFQRSLAGKQYADITTFLLPALLRYEDRNSMAFSIEARVPFLDYHLIEFIFSLPADYRIHQGWNKWLLRQALADILPDRIRWRRDKMGFDTPQRSWMQAARPRLRSLFANGHIRSQTYLQPRRVLAALDDDMIGTGTAQNDLWRWVNLELWLDRFDLT